MSLSREKQGSTICSLGRTVLVMHGARQCMRPIYGRARLCRNELVCVVKLHVGWRGGLDVEVWGLHVCGRVDWSCQQEQGPCGGGWGTLRDGTGQACGRAYRGGARAVAFERAHMHMLWRGAFDSHGSLQTHIYSRHLLTGVRRAPPGRSASVSVLLRVHDATHYTRQHQQPDAVKTNSVSRIADTSVHGGGARAGSRSSLLTCCARY